jgi:hypothetical protein
MNAGRALRAISNGTQPRRQTTAGVALPSGWGGCTAVRQVEAEIAELRPMRAQVENWMEANAANSMRRSRLWQLAELAHKRLANPTPQMMRRVFDLLDVRVTVLAYATHTEPQRVRVEGTVWDGLADANLAGDLSESEPVTPGPRLSRGPPLPPPGPPPRRLVPHGILIPTPARSPPARISPWRCAWSG